MAKPFSWVLLAFLNLTPLPVLDSAAPGHSRSHQQSQLSSLTPPNSSRHPSKLAKVASWLLKGTEPREGFASPRAARALQVLPLALRV